MTPTSSCCSARPAPARAAVLDQHQQRRALLAVEDAGRVALLLLGAALRPQKSIGVRFVSRLRHAASACTRCSARALRAPPYEISRAV